MYSRKRPLICLCTCLHVGLHSAVWHVKTAVKTRGSARGLDDPPPPKKKGGGDTCQLLHVPSESEEISFSKVFFLCVLSAWSRGKWVRTEEGLSFCCQFKILPPYKNPGSVLKKVCTGLAESHYTGQTLQYGSSLVGIKCHVARTCTT